MFICCTRFNNETYKQNKEWKKRKNWSGCAYGFDTKIPDKIPYDVNIYVIEMNNSTNKIMGVGMIVNSGTEKKTRIYKKHSYNRYIYKSKFRASRFELIRKNKKLIEYLEQRLFYGFHHFKRQYGLTLIPDERLVVEYKKPVYRCSICGEPKKNHKCKGVNQKKPYESDKCVYCNKSKKGHVCPYLHKNLNKLNYIHRFFRSLFKT